ncbi:MAG: hypothetical protein QG605_814 [Euryarchaeota archaeon]|nr:hypothetical protein [Euryarchaeota archaeon]
MREIFHSVLVLFMLCLLLAVMPVGAKHTEISDVTRSLSDMINSSEEFAVELTIDGGTPCVVGIVETIPVGFSFPDIDEDVCTSCGFELDRKNRKISFSAIDVATITYHVVAPSSAGVAGTFAGQWVDLLVQTPELDEGKERWNTVTGDESILTVIYDEN